MHIRRPSDAPILCCRTRRRKRGWPPGRAKPGQRTRFATGPRPLQDAAFGYANPLPGHNDDMTELQKSSRAAIIAGMKAALTLSSRGTLTLPAKLRQSLGLKADDQLIAETVPGGLLLRPAVTLPVEMYTDERLAEFEAAEAELASAMARKKRRAR